MALTADRARTIFILALPIVGSMVSQNILNLIDTAMVGSLGNAQVAAVSFASFAAFVTQAFITGLSVGVQALTARRIGESRDDEAAIPLNGGIVLAVLIGLPIAALVFFYAPTVFPLLTRDPLIGEYGGEYLRWRAPGIVAVGINFAFRGYWNGIGRSGVYFRTIILMHVGNIVLNYLLIFGHFGFPELGVAGSALGTTISMWLGAFYYTVQALWISRDHGFAAGLPDRAGLRSLLKTAMPNAFQNLFFAGGLLVFSWIVEKLGTPQAAANGVIVNVMLVLILPGMGYGLAASTLVGQALGRKNPDDASAWAWDVSWIAAATLAIVALPLGILAPSIVDVFLDDPVAIQLAVLPLRLICATIAIDAIGSVMMNGLLGAGDSARVMVVAVTMQWLVFLPAAWISGHTLGFGLVGVWIAMQAQRLIQVVVFVVMWQRGRWKSIKL